MVERPRLPADGPGEDRAPRRATGSGSSSTTTTGDGTFDEVSRAVRAGHDRPAGRAGAWPWATSTTTGASTSWSTTSTAPAQVLRNELPDAGHWLIVALEGKGGNTDAIGAVVTVKAGPLSMTRYVRSGTSYISQDDMRLHFGLGAQAQADLVEVRWPDQTVTRLEKVPANRVLVVKQP